jgi:hypothetical protein
MIAISTTGQRSPGNAREGSDLAVEGGTGGAEGARDGLDFGAGVTDGVGLALTGSGLLLGDGLAVGSTYAPP